MAEIEDQEKKKRVSVSDLKAAKEIIAFVAPYKSMYILGLAFLILSTLAALIIPFLLSQLVDVVNGQSKYFSSLNTLMLLVFITIGFQSLLSFGRVYTFHFVTIKTIADLRKAIYNKVLSLPIPFFEERRVGELISRITADVSKLEETLSLSLAEFLRQIVTLTIGPAFLFFFSVKLTVLMLAVFPLMVILMVGFGRFIRKLSKENQDLLADTNIVVDESFHSINTVKAYTNESYESIRYGKSIDNLISIGLKLAKFRGAFISSLILSMFGSIVLILWYGCSLVIENNLNPQPGGFTTGSLTGFVFYTIFIGGALAGMGDLYAKIQSTLGGTERLLEILHKDSEVPTADSIQKLNKYTTGSIAFENLSFTYPSRPDVTVLKHLNFSIKNGEQIALVGPSGAGKSTITQLLLGFYKVEEGVIKINDKPYNEYPLQEIRHNIGIVPQDISLFGGTIRENIAYGRIDATEQDVIDAATKANAMDFISVFPDGLDTIVGERGVKLSGGQKQRVAIARAILKDPAILILDEATSSLDAESEILVQEALDKLMQNRTTIVIAHRLSTIRKVDRILVINDGEIIESGSHNELVQNTDGLYLHLLKLQFNTK